MSLLLLNRDNRIIGPSNLFLDRAVVGYIQDDGIAYAPVMEKLPFTADQIGTPIGSDVIEDGGTLNFKAIEVIESNFATLLDLDAGVDIAGGTLAGIDFNMRPKRKLTQRQIEFYGAWANGGCAHFICKGELASMPAINRQRKVPTVLDLTYDLTQLTASWPMGICRLYDAVSGALTVTSVPADAATGVLGAAVITLTFNKPMSCLALMSSNWQLVKDSAPTVLLPCTPSFGTTTKGSLTIIDPCKIILTPDVAMTAGAEHTATIFAGIPAVDGTTLAADTVIDFTVAA
jgi:hypothetical protein